jgi:hypothetical protein
MILFASEPQVNLRNHLPPGDSFFSRVNVLDFSLEPRTELRKQLARRGFLFGLIVVIFIPEPQVNLRNHLPPGDLFFSSLHTGKIPLFAIVGAARYSHAPNKKFFLQKESPWPARVRMSAQRSLWPALIAKSVITSPGRIAATIQIVWNLRSSVLVARLQLFTAKPVN